MRSLTGTDITDFHTARYDLLVLTSAGEFAYLDRDAIAESDYEDNRAVAYSYCRTVEGDEVQVLLERDGVIDWFPDALDDDGNLIPEAAADMAEIITADGILPGRASKARKASEVWQQKAQDADRAALDRARAVAEVVAFMGGNQSAAGRYLGLDQAVVNRLVKKATA